MPTGRSTSIPEVSTDNLYVVDPVKHVAYAVEVPYRDANTTESGVQDDAEALAVLGQRAHLDGQDHAAQLDDGCAGAGLDRVENP